MKNITLTVPEDVYRAARICAAEAGTSVSALVGEYLRELTGRAAEFERLALRQHQIQNEIERFRAGDRLDRGAVHERAVR